MAKRNSPHPLTYIVVMGLIGSGLTSWLAPKMIAWYFDPPVDIGVNCRRATEWSMAKLQLAQFIGLGVGALLGLLTWFKLRDRSSADSAPPPRD